MSWLGRRLAPQTTRALAVVLASIVTGATGAGGSGCGPATIAQQRAARHTDLRARASDGEPAAAFELAQAIGRWGASVGTFEDALQLAERAGRSEHAPRHAAGHAAGHTAGHAAGLALHARLLEAAGAPTEALGVWLRLLAQDRAPDVLRTYAAVRVAGLADRVALKPAHGAALSEAAARGGVAGGAAAEALEAVGLRLRDDALVAAARQRLGVVRAYRRTGVLSRTPAIDFPRVAPPEDRLGTHGSGERAGPAESFGEVIATPDGTLAFPEDGPGVFAAQLELPGTAAGAPAQEPLVIELVGTASVRVLLGGRELARVDRLRTLAAERTLVVLPPGSRGTVELIVATGPSGGAAPELRAFLRRQASADAQRHGKARGGLLGRLIALELALWRGDVEASAEAAERLQADSGSTMPLAAVDIARYLLTDPSIPTDLGAAMAQRELEVVLETMPGFREARDLLAQRLLEGGEAAQADAVSRVGGATPATEVALKIAEERGDPPAAAAAARRLVRERPTSCRARNRLLDVRWERLRYSPTEALAGLPRCFELQLRAATLLLEGWKLGRARTLLDELLSRAAPGQQRARVYAELARLSLARGHQAQAAAHAQRGLAEGVQRELLLELWLRAARLAGDEAATTRIRAQLEQAPLVSGDARRRVLDRSADLGLPLVDGAELAREAMSGKLSDAVRAAGVPLHVLLDEQHTRVLPDGSMIHRVHRVVHLLDDAAVEAFGEVAVPEDAELLVARTWVAGPNPKGALRAVEPEEIAEKTAVSLPALAPGVVAEIAWFTLESASPRLAPDWMTPTYVLDSTDAATHLARVILKVTPGMDVKLSVTGQVPAPRRPSPNEWIFEVRDRPRVVAEPLDPRPDRRLASVRASSTLGFGALRDRYREALTPLLRPAPAVRELAETATATAGADPESQLRALFEATLTRVQDGQGGVLDQPASFTALSRSGDRAVLLVALCRAAGFRCDLLLVRPRSRGLAAAPGAVVDLDDHVYPVVRARAVGQELWLDPGSRFHPFHYLPPLLQEAEALDLGADGPALTTTPRLSRREGRRDVEVRIDVAADGRWSAIGHESLDGLFGATWRQVLDGMTAEAQDKGLASVVRDSLPGSMVHEVTLSGAADREAPLKFSWKASGRLDAQGALVLGLSPEGLGPGTLKTPKRSAPLLVNRVRALRMVVKIQLPPGARPTAVPGPVRVDDNGVLLVRDGAWDEQTRELRLVKDLRMRVVSVAAQAYAGWARTARAVDRADVLHLPISLALDAPDEAEPAQ